MASTSESTESTDSILVSERRVTSKSGSFSGTDLGQNKQLYKKFQIERSNLLNIAKICIKTLIDTTLSVGTGRILTEESATLGQFFVVFEHVIRHGLKAKRSFLGQRKDFIAVLEATQNTIPSLPDILVNIQNLTDIKTAAGRTRAWMRLALMQKVLAEQMTLILEQKEFLCEWYEDYSIILNEEGAVFTGMLVGINVIDCNFDLKGLDLDSVTAVLDISLYLRDGNYLEKTHEEKPLDNTDGQKMEVILDQKAYLEQLNQSLSETVKKLKQQAKERQEQDHSSGEEIEQLRNRLVTAIAEREQFKKDYENLLQKHNQRLENVNADMTVERATYEQSRSGLNEMYLKATKELEEEKREKKEVKMMFEEYKQMNKEKELAMQLLEKDIHDKQETLIALRRQLEDIKKINLELHNNWQTSASSLKKHEEEWSSMEQKCSRLISQTKEMEKSLNTAEDLKKEAEETAHQIGANLAKVQAERHTLLTDLKIEREWRASLQSELEANKQKLEDMEKETISTRNALKENDELKAQLEACEKKSRDQEMALVEVGKQLNKSHTQVDELKEIQAQMKDQTWQADREVMKCQQCDMPFTLARRKHHCRKCGGIFCNSCSDNYMPLPSSAKPVRVCDTCQRELLERYSSGNK